GRASRIRRRDRRGAGASHQRGSHRNGPTVQSHRGGRPEARAPARLRGVRVWIMSPGHSREQTGHETMAGMLQAASLRALERVRHAFFTREGGVSEGGYSSLNGGACDYGTTTRVVA